MLYLPINRNWVLSRTAQRIYLGCSVLTLGLLATLMGVHLALSAAHAAALNTDARSVVRFLLFPEILAAAVLWVAMWYFWFGFDRSHYVKRALSFVLLFFFGPLGTLFYYFVTYRRRVASVGLADAAPREPVGFRSPI